MGLAVVRKQRLDPEIQPSRGELLDQLVRGPAFGLDRFLQPRKVVLPQPRLSFEDLQARLKVIGKRNGAFLPALREVGGEDQATAAVGGIAGKVKGLETAKSVGDLSVSCDVTTGSYAGAGSWNLTSYGLRFYALARMIGAGGIQLPGC